MQVERPRVFVPDAARSGLVLMAWGFFKKLVVADNVAIIANRVFAHDAPSFEILWAGVFAFGMQIYADFSAYSDIARGVARWFGFELIVNFNHPYIAYSPSDFWRRWHISLSTWFRDYVSSRSAATACRGCRARSTCWRPSSSLVAQKCSEPCCGASFYHGRCAITRTADGPRLPALARSPSPAGGRDSC